MCEHFVSPSLNHSEPDESWHCHLRIHPCHHGRKNPLIEKPGSSVYSGSQLTLCFWAYIIAEPQPINPRSKHSPHRLVVVFKGRNNKWVKFTYMHPAAAHVINLFWQGWWKSQRIVWGSCSWPAVRGPVLAFRIPKGCITLGCQAAKPCIRSRQSVFSRSRSCQTESTAQNAPFHGKIVWWTFLHYSHHM